jgi:hypothetical protein
VWNTSNTGEHTLILDVSQSEELKRIVALERDQKQKSVDNFNVILMLLECLRQEMPYGEKLGNLEKSEQNFDR